MAVMRRPLAMADIRESSKTAQAEAVKPFGAHRGGGIKPARLTEKLRQPMAFSARHPSKAALRDESVNPFTARSS
jgi:hypothetical protein